MRLAAIEANDTDECSHGEKLQHPNLYREIILRGREDQPGYIIDWRYLNNICYMADIVLIADSEGKLKGYSTN